MDYLGTVLALGCAVFLIIAASWCGHKLRQERIVSEGMRARLADERALRRARPWSATHRMLVGGEPFRFEGGQLAIIGSQTIEGVRYTDAKGQQWFAEWAFWVERFEPISIETRPSHRAIPKGAILGLNTSKGYAGAQSSVNSPST